MMKKVLLSVITGSMILAGSTCSATVPADQLVLGGIQYGASISAVESVHQRSGKCLWNTPQVGTRNEVLRRKSGVQIRQFTGI